MRGRNERKTKGRLMTSGVRTRTRAWPNGSDRYRQKLYNPGNVKNLPVEEGEREPAKPTNGLANGI